MVKNYLFRAVLIASCTFVAACSTTQSPLQNIPNYNQPETSYISPHWDEMKLNAISNHSGKYITFEGYFLDYSQAYLDYATSVESEGVRSLAITMNPKQGSYPLQILWLAEDEEFSNKASKLTKNEKVKVYAYVVPANQSLVSKRSAKKFEPFSQPVIAMVDFEPLN